VTTIPRRPTPSCRRSGAPAADARGSRFWGARCWRSGSLITEGTFGINIDDFILQDNNGFVTTAAAVPTTAQVEGDEEITEEADLANGESVELPMTFEVVSSVGPQSVFYRPDDERLVDVAELG
jgi:hypothetical protein